jgi:hypothetical protein
MYREATVFRFKKGLDTPIDYFRSPLDQTVMVNLVLAFIDYLHKIIFLM